MKQMIIVALLATLLGGGVLAESHTSPPPSEKPDIPEWVKKIRFSGKFYLNYQDGFRKESDRVVGKSADDEGAFRVTRAYAGVAYQATAKTAFALVLDAAPRRLDGGPYAVVLKKLFVSHEYRKGHTIYLGQADLPWVVFVEDTQGDRFARLTFSESEGYLSSADLGLLFKGTVAANRLRYHVGVVNGNNWAAPETDRTKDAHALLVATPFAKSTGWQKGFFVSVGGVRKQYTASLLRSDEHTNGYRLNGLTGYQSANVLATIEVLGTKDPSSRISRVHPSANAGDVHGVGFSTFVHMKGLAICPKASEKLGFLARLDHLDPTRGQVENDSHTRVFIGPTWTFSKNLQVWSGYAGARYAAGSKVARLSQNYLGFFLEAKF